MALAPEISLGFQQVVAYPFRGRDEPQIHCTAMDLL
jgi:hypothetical protein